jgi:hypothetical protein
MAEKQEFIVLCAQVVGSGIEASSTEYNFDGRRFADRKGAINHGFELGRSDDFNIGIVEGARLVSLDWMDEEVVESDPAKLDAIAESACIW